MENEEVKQHKYNAKKVIICVIIAAVCFVLCVFLWQYNSMTQVLNTNTIYNGVYIKDISVGGLTKEELKEKIKNTVQKDIKDKDVELISGKYSEKINYSELVKENEYEKIIQDAYNVGRKGNFFERYNIVKSLQQNPIKLQVTYEFDDEKIKKILNDLKKKVYIKPLSATIKRQGNNFVITEEKEGQELDLEKSAQTIKQNLQEGYKKQIKLITNSIEPKFTKNELSNITVKLSEFSTKFDANKVDRVTNLQVAASKINGYVVRPNEIFSTAKVLGPVSVKSGYKEANVIVNGKLTPGIGGGVCQVATTLYNTLLKTNLKIVERHNHSIPVAYVKLGMDAVISGDYLDLKFKNTTQYPIYIEGAVQGSQVLIRLYGHDIMYKDGTTVAFESTVTKKIEAPQEKVVEDPTLEKGKRIVEVSSKEGMEVELYKKTYKNGSLQQSELVDKSKYKAVQSEVKVGTKVQ